MTRQPRLAITLIVIGSSLLRTGVSQPATPAQPFHPYSVFNCGRFGNQGCNEPFVRMPYPKELAEYLFWSTEATWKVHAAGKLRKSKPVDTSRKFELGDLTLPYDSVRWTIRTTLVNGEPVSREEIISLSGWINKDDLSARLFAFGWLHIWNLNLVEPFPDHCPVVFDYEKRQWKRESKYCTDLEDMADTAVISAKFHQGMRHTSMLEKYRDVPFPMFQNSRQRWVYSA